MKLTIAVDKLLFLVLILSCQVSGAGFEVVFYLALAVLIYRNREKIKTEHYFKLFICVVVLYSILTLVQYVHDSGDFLYRTIGIAKCMSGISLCVLFADRLCRQNVYDILFYVLILLNIGSIYSTITEVYTVMGLEMVGHNTCVCINLMFLPHFLWGPYKEKKLARILYIITLAGIGLSYFSGYFWAGFIILGAVAFIRRVKLPSMTKEARNILITIFFVIAIFCIYSLMADGKIQELYYMLMDKFDISRTQILSQGITKFKTFDEFEKFFGTGDNIYTLYSGRQIEAHNFIVEAAFIFGGAGLAVLIFDSIVFVGYILTLNKVRSCQWTIVTSLVLGYLGFLLNPFYTTNFVSKIFFVLLNINTCYMVRKTQENNQGTKCKMRKNICR